MDAGKPIDPDQHQQDGGNQQLVGDGIKKPTETGLLAPSARKVAIEKIRHAREQERGKSKPTAPVRLQHQKETDHHTRCNTRKGENIGQITRHRQTGAVRCRITIGLLPHSL